MSTPCAALAIGSEMSGGVRNVSVSDCFLHDSTAGIHIKSGAGRGGYVRDILYEDLRMINCAEDIMIDTDRSSRRWCYSQVESLCTSWYSSNHRASNQWLWKHSDRKTARSRSCASCRHYSRGHFISWWRFIQLLESSWLSLEKRHAFTSFSMCLKKPLRIFNICK